MEPLFSKVSLSGVYLSRFGAVLLCLWSAPKICLSTSPFLACNVWAKSSQKNAPQVIPNKQNRYLGPCRWLVITEPPGFTLEVINRLNQANSKQQCLAGILTMRFKKGVRFLLQDTTAGESGHRATWHKRQKSGLNFRNWRPFVGFNPTLRHQFISAKNKKKQKVNYVRLEEKYVFFCITFVQFESRTPGVRSREVSAYRESKKTKEGQEEQTLCVNSRDTVRLIES